MAKPTGDTPALDAKRRLKLAGWRVHIQRRGHTTKEIPETQKRRNRAIATTQARIDHVFGALAQIGGKLVRRLGIVRTTFVLQLKVASYNLRRFVFLKELGLAPF